MGTRRHYKRSDLFLVRVWEEASDDGTGKPEWHGKVQRVVDGEVHQFAGWADLTEALQSMLALSKRDKPPPLSNQE